MLKVRTVIFIAMSVLVIAGLAFAGGDVEKGKALFNDPSLGTNGKSCSSCHPGGSNINGQKNSFTIMGKKQATVKEAINFCVKMALKGKPLKEDSEKMENLAAYVKTLKGKKRKRKLIKGC